MSSFFVIGNILSAAVAIVLLWPLRAHRKLTMFSIIAMVLCSWGIYWQLGTPMIIPLMQAYHTQQNNARATVETQKNLLANDANDIEAWITMGQAYIDLEEWKPAGEAFKQAILLSKGHPSLILAYAKTLISEANGQVTEDAKQALDMVLLQVPDSDEAQYYSIIYTLQQGNTQEAMSRMKILYNALDEESPLKAQIDRQIGRD